MVRFEFSTMVVLPDHVFIGYPREVLLLQPPDKVTLSNQVRHMKVEPGRTLSPVEKEVPRLFPPLVGAPMLLFTNVRESGSACGWFLKASCVEMLGSALCVW